MPNMFTTLNLNNIISIFGQFALIVMSKYKKKHMELNLSNYSLTKKGGI
jgi:hypothetical protein